MGELIACKDGRALEVMPIDDVIAAQVMAHIRNECRAGFSADNGIITREAQYDWWQANHNRVVACLYSEPFGAWVGYGLLRPDGAGRIVSSVAVLPEFAGRGYGGAITRHIIRQHLGPIHAAALESNQAAMALHHADDWIETGRAGGVVYYRTREDLV